MFKPLYLATLFSCSFATLAAPALPDATAVNHYATTLLEQQAIASDGPGLAILVARDDKALFKHAYGQASIELGVPLKPEHKFRIGSVTKQMAAAALLKLIDDGKAALNDPLSKYLPDYPKGSEITLLQLLNHTSGVKSYTGIAGYMHNNIRRELTTAELIDEFKDLPFDFEPGSAFKYNNSGYVLLGAVIENISGQSWHQYLNDAILAPNKLSHILYPGETSIVAGMASGYGQLDDNPATTASLLSMTQPHAAGALVADLTALWQWNRTLHEGKVLKPDTYTQMVTPTGAAAENGGNYGFGITTGSLRGLTSLQHGGGINGFSSLLLYIPETKVTVAILSNNESPGVNFDYISRKLAAFAAGKEYPDYQTIDLTEPQLQEFSGVYSKGEDSRTLQVRHGKLYSIRAGGQPFELTPQANDFFGFSDSITRLSAQRDNSGKVISVTMHYDADDAGQQWLRTGDVASKADIPLTTAQQQALLGRYASDELKLQILLSADGAGLQVQLEGQPALDLKAATERSLYLTVVDASLEFAPETGPVQHVTLTQGPARIVLARQ